MKKNKLLFAILILLGIIIFFSFNVFALNEHIKIDGSLRITIPPMEGNFHGRFLFTPIFIIESYENEIIIWRGSFLQIYSQEGQSTKILGRRGEGPGEFYLISDISKSNGVYYILDFPNRLNIFDKQFTYKKRFDLAGEKNSSIIYDLSVENNTIAAAQRWRGSSPLKDKTISIYTGEGKWINSFFEKKKGWKSFPNDSILGGKIIVINKTVYFAYQTINCIWKFNLQGDLIKEKSFGKSWWRKVSYNKKEELKAKKRKGYNPGKYYEEVISSGDLIDRMYYYKNHLLLLILRDHEGIAETIILLLDLNLEIEEGPFFLKGYYLSGVGKEYLYFTRYLGEYSSISDTDAEILKCRIIR